MVKVTARMDCCCGDRDEWKELRRCVYRGIVGLESDGLLWKMDPKMFLVLLGDISIRLEGEEYRINKRNLIYDRELQTK